MAEVRSTFKLESGAVAPAFTLPDGAGESHCLAEISEGKAATVVIFACNHCPFVVHLADSIAAAAGDYSARGVAFVAVNSNDVDHYPADAPENMVVFAARHGWEFPYLYDRSQAVAKAYAAACTPDFYVFGGGGELAYAGQFDASRPGNAESVTGIDLRGALDAVLAGQAVAGPWRPSSGCNIKWKPDNAPSYFS